MNEFSFQILPRTQQNGNVNRKYWLAHSFSNPEASLLAVLFLLSFVIAQHSQDEEGKQKRLRHCDVTPMKTKEVVRQQHQTRCIRGSLRNSDARLLLENSEVRQE